MGTNVALFVDFENIRYSMHAHYRGREPRIHLLRQIAEGYGTLVRAIAYADFREHPERYERKLRNAGIEVRSLPKRKAKKGFKNSADIELALDAVETVFDYPDIDAFVIMSGDKDFVKLATLLRRKGKKVIISAVRGAPLAYELVTAAGDNFVPVDPVPEVLDDSELWKYIVTKTRDLTDLAKKHVNASYISDVILDDPDCELVKKHDALDIISKAQAEGILESYMHNGRRYLRLNESHQLVRQLAQKVAAVRNFPSPVQREQRAP